MRPRLLLFVMLALSVLSLVASAMAQAAGDKPDLAAVGVAAIAALTPVLSGLVLWYAKILWSKVPASIVLLAAPLMGVAVNYLLSWLSGHSGDFSPLAAAALGMLATWLREFISTVASKGLNGSVSVTKAMF
jgi:hypothetical protein